MSKTVRVQWEYPDFEVDDDATPEEIQNEAEDIAFEHFSWSFWDVTKGMKMKIDIPVGTRGTLKEFFCCICCWSFSLWNNKIELLPALMKYQF